MGLQIQILKAGNEHAFARVAPGVFDEPIDARLVAEFLADPHHHIAAAIEDDMIIGFVSAVDYIHPDKPRELWINEVGVAPSHHRRGIARQVLDCMLDHGRNLGCRQAWVLTERPNIAAMRLYQSTGGLVHSPETVMFDFDLTARKE
ncbi:MAG: GNAT family N-acetyltransferase [Alphaproteobacteria bacterium]